MHQPPYPPAPPRPPRRRRFIAWTVGAAVAACLAGAGVARLAHHGDGGGLVANQAACKAAAAANYRKVMANGGKGPPASEPPACVGLSTKTLERIMGEVVDEYMDSNQAKKDSDKFFKDLTQSPSATPSASTSVSPECRAWIAKELRDSSSSIDATAGYAACGDVSDDQMQKAIDEVEKELEASIAATP